MADPYKFFGLSCPSGGNFYICSSNTTEFLGCCTTDPCTTATAGRCPAANLRPASFSADKYDQMPRQDCDDARSIKIWYTCKFNKPPFMGCCNSNPCANGNCPLADLVPAKLSGDSDFRQPFLVPTPSGSATASASTATATATATATSATAVADSSAPPAGGGGLSAGAVAGIAVAVAVVLLVAVGATMYRWGWKARSAKTKNANGGGYASPRPEGYGMSETVYGEDVGIRYGGGFSPYRDSYNSNHPTLAYGPGSPPLYPKHGGYYEGAMHSPPFHAGYHPRHNRNPSHLSEMGTDPIVSELPGHEPPPRSTGTPELAGRQQFANTTPATATTAAFSSPTIPPSHPSSMANSTRTSPMMPSPGRFDDGGGHIPGTRRPLVGGSPRGYDPVRAMSPDPDD